MLYDGPRYKWGVSILLKHIPKWGFTRLLNVLSVAFNWLNHEDSPSQNKIDLDDFPVIVMAMLCGELLVIQAPYVVAYRLLCNKIHTSSYIIYYTPVHT